MDRIAYIAAGGAARVLEHQAMLTNNMANAGTTGFRAQLAAYRAVPVTGAGQSASQATRTSTVSTTANSLFTAGPIQSTGRDLDVAIAGDGWFVVQTGEGEAYTRAGNFRCNVNGQLVTAAGRLVLSTGDQPIDLGDSEKISVDRNGGINAIPKGGSARDIQRIAQIKLALPEPASLVRGADGLFRAVSAEGKPQRAEANTGVQVMGGALEGSNASATDNMVKLIASARHFEMQMKVVSDAAQNEQRANSILSDSN